MAASSASGEFTRSDIIEAELGRIVEETGSTGRSPDQTLSRELQQLRKAGVLRFLTRGRYRLTDETAEEPSLELAVMTQRLALHQARVGQGPFRSALLERWQVCPLTGIGDGPLLRASHIVAWGACPSGEERLEPLNGLLLSALWDAAFDKGLVTFENDGNAVLSPKLSANAGRALLAQGKTRIDGLCDGNRARLAVHRHFFDKGEWPTP
jgi:hypothetical protein